MDKNDWKGYLRPRILLIAFGVALYTFLQIPNRLWFALGWAWRVFSPIILGLAIAFVLNVFLDFLERVLKFLSRDRLRGGVRRVLCIALTIALMVSAFTLILFVILPALGDTVNQVIEYLPESSNEAAAWAGARLTELGINPEMVANLQQQFLDLINQLLEYLKSESVEVAHIAFDVTASILELFLALVLGVIFAIYVLAGKEKIGRFANDLLRKFIPHKTCDRIIEISHLSFNMFATFVKGQLLEACILGMLCFVGMLLFRFPSPAIISLVMGVTALIPIFGAWIGAAVGAFLILIVSPIKALLFIVFILVLQQLENNLIYPRVVGQSMGLPGILVLSAITVGGNIAGVMGMLLGVPLCSVVYVLVKQAVYGKGVKGKHA